MLTSPLMLLGLLALPALGAIYWLRSRSRRVVVSSLVLWSDQRRARQGGRIIERMQTPLTFFLELLVILLCVMAAAGPALVKRDVVRPLVVVLDDSYSMQAEDGERQSPRRQAEAALTDLLGRDSYVARLLTAGSGVRSIGESIRAADEAQPLLDAWTCQSGGADLYRGIATATEIGGSKARILVLSDHPPPMPLGGGQIQWWAFGTRLPNMAITAATRTYAPEQERVLIEVTNLSDAADRTTLTLQGGNLAAPKTMPVDLAHGAAKQFFLNLPLGAAPLQASLGDDVLDLDNRAILLPEPAKPLRVRLDVIDAELRRAVQRVLDATDMALIVTEKPELSISDGQLGGTSLSPSEGRGNRTMSQEATPFVPQGVPPVPPYAVNLFFSSRLTCIAS